MIVLVGSIKGGVGKTTIACNLATALALKNIDICLVDADKQSSSHKWASIREELGHEPSIQTVQKYGNISKTLKGLDEKYDVVIVDVAGSNSREMLTAAAVADIWICPSQCSQFDLDTLEEMQDQVEKVKDLNPELNIYIYQNMASTNSKVIEVERKEFKNWVSEYPEFELLKSVGFYRKIYKDAVSEGISVLETNNQPATLEMKSLYKEVFKGR